MRPSLKWSGIYHSTSWEVEFRSKAWRPSREAVRDGAVSSPTACRTTNCTKDGKVKMAKAVATETAAMRGTEFSSFEEFWPYYLRHTDPDNAHARQDGMRRYLAA